MTDISTIDPKEITDSQTLLLHRIIHRKHKQPLAKSYVTTLKSQVSPAWAHGWWRPCHRSWETQRPTRPPHSTRLHRRSPRAPHAHGSPHPQGARQAWQQREELRLVSLQRMPIHVRTQSTCSRPMLCCCQEILYQYILYRHCMFWRAKCRTVLSRKFGPAKILVRGTKIPEITVCPDHFFSWKFGPGLEYWSKCPELRLYRINHLFNDKLRPQLQHTCHITFKGVRCTLTLYTL